MQILLTETRQRKRSPNVRETVFRTKLLELQFIAVCFQSRSRAPTQTGRGRRRGGRAGRQGPRVKEEQAAEKSQEAATAAAATAAAAAARRGRGRTRRVLLRLLRRRERGCRRRRRRRCGPNAGLCVGGGRRGLHREVHLGLLKRALICECNV